MHLLFRELLRPRAWWWLARREHGGGRLVGGDRGVGGRRLAGSGRGVGGVEGVGRGRLVGSGRLAGSGRGRTAQQGRGRFGSVGPARLVGGRLGGQQRGGLLGRDVLAALIQRHAAPSSIRDRPLPLRRAARPILLRRAARPLRAAFFGPGRREVGKIVGGHLRLPAQALRRGRRGTLARFRARANLGDGAGGGATRQVVAHLPDAQGEEQRNRRNREHGRKGEPRHGHDGVGLDHSVVLPSTKAFPIRARVSSAFPRMSACCASSLSVVGCTERALPSAASKSASIRSWGTPSARNLRA